MGKVVIQKPTEAINAARDAAFTLSTPNEVRFCTFSDGSYKYERGGVGLVYRRQWLPKEWAPEQQPTDPNRDFVKTAWPYARAIGSMVMEGVGVLKGLQAANKAIRRDLHVLKAQHCTITVRGTTDCAAILRHIARNDPTWRTTIPSELIKMIKLEIQQLHSHGIRVIVELHWCPRNEIPQLELADKLAGHAMAGLVRCYNTKQDCWVTVARFDMAQDIERLAFGAACSDQAAKAHERSAASQSTTLMSLKKSEERRGAERAANVTRAAENISGSYPQLPLPSIALPSKPAMNVPATVDNAGSTKTLDTKTTATFSTEAQHSNEPVTVEAVRREAKQEETKSRRSQSRRRNHHQGTKPRTMLLRRNRHRPRGLDQNKDTLRTRCRRRGHQA